MPDMLVFYPKKHGHFASYAQTLKTFSNSAEFIEGRIRPIRMMAVNKLVIVHGDGLHLLFSILALFRSLFYKKTYFFSVRTNELFGRGYVAFFKRQLVRLIALQRNSYFISIHKGNSIVEEASRSHRLGIVFIYDLQLWDLSLYEKLERERPHEIDNHFIGGSKPILLILGEMNQKRCISELTYSFDTLVQRFRVIIAGKILDRKFADIVKRKIGDSVLVIDRYLTDAEVNYLYIISNYVYAYYSDTIERPSGIFGRALQMGRYVFVKKNGFLDKCYGDRVFVIPVEKISDMQANIFCKKPISISDERYNSSGFLANLII